MKSTLKARPLALLITLAVLALSILSGCKHTDEHPSGSEHPSEHPKK